MSANGTAACVLAAAGVLGGSSIGLPGASVGGDNTHFLTLEITNTARFVRSVAAADVDGDGDLDLLSALPVNAQVVWFENGGTPNDKFDTRHVIDADPNGALWIQAADLDGDGDVNPVVGIAQGFHSEILWYENFGGSPPAFGKNVVTTNVNGVESIHLADVDGDGDVDVLSATLLDDMIAWYENDGNSPPSFAQHVITMDPDGLGPLQGFADGVWFVSAGDVDGDCDADLLFTAAAERLLGWFENEGGQPPSFTPHIVTIGFTPINGPASVLAVDMDADGDLDLVSSSVTDDRIAWHENDGNAPPSFTFHNITQTADAPWSIAAADMDADGDVDLLSPPSRTRRWPGTRTTGRVPRRSLSMSCRRRRTARAASSPPTSTATAGPTSSRPREGVTPSPGT